MRGFGRDRYSQSDIGAGDAASRDVNERMEASWMGDSICSSEVRRSVERSCFFGSSRDSP